MIFENVVAMDALEWSFQLWGFANLIGCYVYYVDTFKSSTCGELDWIQVKPLMGKNMLKW